MNSKTNKVATAFLLSSASSSLSADAFSPAPSFKASQQKAKSTTTTVACQKGKDSSSDAEKSRRTFMSNFSGVSAMYCGVISSNYVTNKVSSESQDCGCKGMVHVCGAGFSRPMNVNAFYERDVGGDNPSPETAAFNIQARKTNARLEAEGFPLDTKEEEAKRLSDAMSSFSYNDNAYKYTSSKTKTRENSARPSSSSYSDRK
eukprot:CAMPEP_0178958768 /NCGR_PEP_ID=MMETSP0789-20121207/11843_1 /TAXON_ID=3005 /ORGANISM="Rhizosolenia setigera, Strain CCMP 1694" /LENGTH=202 /DNA_ID=CAMNT_0020641545 /DNA_START=35 /DNA_END=643 /DNA_ORIENTATION=+